MRLFSILRSHHHLSALKVAGADGILLGMAGLSYRTPLYSLDEATEILKQAKILGLEVYFQLNRLLDEDDIQVARSFIEEIEPFGFDGVLYQDLAYVSFLKNKPLKSIYAPEAIVTHSQEVSALCTRGIDFVMLAKELTLDEIVKIACDNPMRVALFGFGHLPMAVSRRPLVRNYLDEIDQDRALSFGTKLTLKEEKRSVYFPILEDEKDTVVFSDTVFCALEELNRLNESGIALLIADDIFVDEDVLTDVIRSSREILNGSNPATVWKQFAERIPGIAFSDGYYHKKTNLTKEGTNL